MLRLSTGTARSTSRRATRSKNCRNHSSLFASDWKRSKPRTANCGATSLNALGRKLRRSNTGDGLARRHGHVAQPRAGGREDGVADGGRDADDADLAGARGGQVFAVDEDDFDLRHVCEAGQPVVGEVWVVDLAVAEADCFKQRAAKPLHDGAHVLVSEAVGVYNCSGLPRLYDANH